MIVPHDYLSERHTDRLFMRPLTQEHIPAWIHFLKDERAIAFYPERGINPEESAANWIEVQKQRYLNGSFGLMALHLEDGTFIGQCGLITQQVDGEIVLEIGYHLFPAYWKKGYASEAAIYFKEYAQQHAITDEVVSIIHKDNVLSQAVAKRNGMQPWKASEWDEKPVIVYSVSLV